MAKPKRISATTARRAFGKTVAKVARGTRIVIQRRGEDTVALVPLEDLERLEALGAAQKAAKPTAQSKTKPGQKAKPPERKPKSPDRTEPVPDP